MLREQQHVASRHGGAVADGDGNHIQERIRRYQHGERNEREDDDVKRLVSEARRAEGIRLELRFRTSLHHFLSLPHHRDEPVTLRDSVLLPSTKMKPTTE